MDSKTAVLIAKAKKMVLDSVSTLDPSGWNYNYYNNKFKEMSDYDLIKFFKTPDAIRLYATPMKTEPTLDAGLKLCEKLGVPAMEDVTAPFLYIDKDSGEELICDKKVLVIYIKVKRLHQIINKENKSSSDIKTRDMKTNLVTGESKAAMLSDTDVAMTAARGYHKVIEELLTVRADHTNTKEEFYASILKTGKANIPKDIHRAENKTVIPLLHFMYLGAGMYTDLVEDGVERELYVNSISPVSESYPAMSYSELSTERVLFKESQENNNNTPDDKLANIGDIINDFILGGLTNKLKNDIDTDDNPVFIPNDSHIITNNLPILETLSHYLEKVIMNDELNTTEYNSTNIVTDTMYKDDTNITKAVMMDSSNLNKMLVANEADATCNILRMNGFLISIVHKDNKILEIYLLFRNDKKDGEDTHIINYIEVMDELLELTKTTFTP